MTSKSHSLLDAIKVPEIPFPGLRPFESNESRLFFGRDEQIEKLMTKLADKRFLAVVGTSGSGKSSLVRAGLMHALRSGMMSGAGHKWRIAVMRPSNDPIGNLARALNAPEVFGSDDAENAAIQIAIAEATLRLGSRGLIETVRQNVMPETENLLVVVDQFEELFRFAREARKTGSERYDNDAAAFVKLLLEAVKPDDKGEREANIYVVLTMRSDFLGDCSQFWDLPEAINESQYLIPRLTRDQLREVIEGPIAVGGGQIAPRLVNQLLNDITDNQDQLPILQHALMRTWDEWKHPLHGHQSSPGVIDICCYEETGGMAEALSRHADEAYDELDDTHQKIAEKMFKSLTEKGEDNREIRRPVTLAEICAVTEATEAAVISVIEKFRAPGKSFLMPPAEALLNADSLIDISHESLIRNWQRLSGWVDEEAASSREYLRLVDTATRFREGRESLLRDSGLQTALDWRDKQKPNQDWAQRYHRDFEQTMNFLDESRAAREADVKRYERLRLEAEEKRKRELRRTRIIAAMLLAAFLFSLASAVFAWQKRATALRFAEEAKKQKEVAEAATEEAKKKTEEAEASADRARKQTEIAEAATKKAEVKTKEAKASADKARKQTQIAENNQRKAAEESEKNRHLYYATSMNLARSEFEKGNRSRGYELLESFLDKPKSEDVRNFYWYYLWKQNHSERLSLKHAAAVNTVALSPNGRILASGASDGTIKLWDVANGRELIPLKGHLDSVNAVAFSPDGKTLASVSGHTRLADTKDFNLELSGALKLWDIETGVEKVSVHSNEDLFNSVTFSPDGHTLASGSGSLSRNESQFPSSFMTEGFVKIWEVRSRCELKKRLKGFGIKSVTFSSSGQTLAFNDKKETEVGVRTDRVRLWDIRNEREIPAIEMIKDNIDAITFLPNEPKLAVIANKKTVSTWEVTSHQMLDSIKVEEELTSVTFSPDGNILVLGARDGTIKLREVVKGKELPSLKGHGESVNSIFFSSDGRTLASGANDGTVKLYDVKNQQEPTIPKKNIERVDDVISSPDGQIFALFDYESNKSKVEICDAKNWQAVASFEQKGSIYHPPASFSPDNQILALADNGEVSLRDIKSGQELTLLKWPSESIQAVSFSPDGQFLAAGSAKGAIKLWNRKDGREQVLPNKHDGPVSSLSFSPDGQKLASASDDTRIGGFNGSSSSGTVKLWDMKNGRELITLKGNEGGFHSVTFSPNGQMLAAGSAKGTVNLWNARGQEIARLKGHNSLVTSITFSPDSSTMASGSRDVTTKLWAVQSQQELNTLSGTDGFGSVAFINGGRVLVGLIDGEAKLYIAATDEEVKAQRNTQQEATKPAGKR